MFKILIVSFAMIACAVAKPGLLAAAPLAYANAPLYAAGGSQQIDIRNNYDGTLSSYATAPFGYAGPVSSRYVAGVPAAYAAAAPLATPFAAAHVATPFAHNLAAPALAAPLAHPYAAHYAAGPIAAPFGAHFAASAPLLV